MDLCQDFLYKSGYSSEMGLTGWQVFLLPLRFVIHQLNDSITSICGGNEVWYHLEQCREAQTFSSRYCLCWSCCGSTARWIPWCLAYCSPQKDYLHSFYGVLLDFSAPRSAQRSSETYCFFVVEVLSTASSLEPKERARTRDMDWYLAQGAVEKTSDSHCEISSSFQKSNPSFDSCFSDLKCLDFRCHPSWSIHGLVRNLQLRLSSNVDAYRLLLNQILQNLINKSN